MGKFEVQIFDDTWPKLRFVGSITLPNGQRITTEEKVNYDQAYNKFEGACHNLLQKLVQNMIDRRKNPSQMLGIQNQT